MTKVEDAYAALKARLIALFPSHTRLSMPYVVEENTELALKQGWGIQISPAINTERMVSCQMSVERTFVVILTRRFIARELDRDSKEIVELDLVEDHDTLIKDIEGDPTLGVSDTIARARYISDNGIELVNADRDNFFKIESSIAIEYFEDLT